VEADAEEEGEVNEGKVVETDGGETDLAAEAEEVKEDGKCRRFLSTNKNT
jgi:hypothetical protein